MSYVKSDGTYVYSIPFPPLPSAARTISDSSAAVETAGMSLSGLLLDVTAVTGTNPTLTVSVEVSRDGATWYSGGSYAVATAVSQQVKNFIHLDRWVRLTWVIGGTATPTFTFSLSGGELT